MKVGVLGPTGFSGSHCAVELLNRGHDVVGISRNPERLGQHEKYTPCHLAVETAPIEDIIATFSGLDVLVNAYNPSPGPGLYSMQANNLYEPPTASNVATNDLGPQKPSSKQPAASSSPPKPLPPPTQPST